MMILELSFASTGNDVDEVIKSSPMSLSCHHHRLHHEFGAQFSETAVDRVEMT